MIEHSYDMKPGGKTEGRNDGKCFPVVLPSFRLSVIPSVRHSVLPSFRPSVLANRLKSDSTNRPAFRSQRRCCTVIEVASTEMRLNADGRRPRVRDLEADGARAMAPGAAAAGGDRRGSHRVRARPPGRSRTTGRPGRGEHGGHP